MRACATTPTIPGPSRAAPGGRRRSPITPMASRPRARSKVWPHRAGRSRRGRQARIARDELMIAVVGAIDEQGAASLVDKAFADLPAKAL